VAGLTDAPPPAPPELGVPPALDEPPALVEPPAAVVLAGPVVPPVLVEPPAAVEPAAPVVPPVLVTPPAAVALATLVLPPELDVLPTLASPPELPPVSPEPPVSAALAPPVSPGWLEPPELTVLLALVLPPELAVLPPERLPPGSPPVFAEEQDAATSAKPATRSIWRVVRFIYLLLRSVVRASLGREPGELRYHFKSGIHIRAAPIGETSHSIPQTQCQ
jgi:hypothetical protein